jgi:hypothetical protein
MSSSRLAKLLALAVGSALGPLGCEDPPITLTVGDGGGEGPGSDAAVDGGFQLSTCKACMAAPDEPGPGCDNEYGPCEADPKCTGILQCIYAAGCFGGKSSRFLSCGIPCVEEAGVLTSTDPSLGTATSLFECVVNGACGPSCTTK